MAGLRSEPSSRSVAGKTTTTLANFFPLPAAVIASTAFAVVLPFFFCGNASGHDFEFHVLSWMEVVSQWKQAIVYPRWAAFAHWGYGEARFLVYPPASWNLGALLGILLPWKMAPVLIYGWRWPPLAARCSSWRAVG